MGVALAAPIVLDFERRTHRLVWTQSITRRRWFATKLGTALLGVLVFSLVLTLLMSWWFIPQDRVQDPFGQGFNVQGFVPFAYAVFTLALALAVGALTRRTVLATIVAIIVFVPVWGVVQDAVRPHYLAPIERTTALSKPQQQTAPERAWVVGEYLIDKEGNRLTDRQRADEIDRSGTKDPSLRETRASEVSSCISRRTGSGHFRPSKPPSSWGQPPCCWVFRSGWSNDG